MIKWIKKIKEIVKGAFHQNCPFFHGISSMYFLPILFAYNRYGVTGYLYAIRWLIF